MLNIIASSYKMVNFKQIDISTIIIIFPILLNHISLISNIRLDSIFN